MSELTFGRVEQRRIAISPQSKQSRRNWLIEINGDTGGDWMGARARDPSHFRRHVARQSVFCEMILGAIDGRQDERQLPRRGVFVYRRARAPLSRRDSQQP